MPKALTAEDIRETVLAQIRVYVNYWANDSITTDLKEKLDGLAFSILNIIDGTGSPFCSMDLVMRPHSESKQYHIDNGKDWIEDGIIINRDVLMHEMYYRTT